MMKIRTMIAAFALLLAAGTAQAQMKIGFVDVNKIVTQLPEYTTINGQLQGLQQRFVDTLRAYQSNWQSRFEDYQRRQSMLNPEARQTEEQTLGAMRDSIQAYQIARLGNEGTLAQVQAQLLAPLRDKIKGAVERVAREQKLNGVMTVEAMVYYDKSLDITYKVLEALNRD